MMRAMGRQDLCDVCGNEVPAVEAVRHELSVGDMTCPTPMTMHPACYERASSLWQPNPDSLCTTDPEFPETTRWTPAPTAGS